MVSITIKTKQEPELLKHFKYPNYFFLNNIGKIIGPILLTEEILHTQFHDKVDGYNTSDYTTNYYKQEEFEETTNDIYKILFDFETITSGEKNICLISVGCIMMTSSRGASVLILVLLIC